MKLCIDCKYYKAEQDEVHDKCTHAKSQSGGVRQIDFYYCLSMRVGLCKDGVLFEPASEQVQS